jgi:hypothetical protein
VDLFSAALVGILGAVVLWTFAQLLSAGRAAREQAERAYSLQLIALFAPGIVAAIDDPRALLAWQPLATTARRLFPKQFAELDRASGATFPFSVEQIQAAHARWTADWLAWERAHDGEYKLRASVVEEEMGRSGASALGRARLDAIEREKLDRYQRRYEDYTRVSKALQSLLAASGPQSP